MGAVLDLARVLFEPTAVFERVREKPRFFAVFLVINALILWVSTSVLGGEGKFATLLSVTTYAAITYSLLQVIGVVVLMMRGPGSVTSMLDLQPSLGLDLLAPDAKGFTLGLLRGINPFTLYG